MTEKLTNKSIRKENQFNIVYSILKEGGILRNDLAVKNNISIMTVKKIVDDLIRFGIAEEYVFDTTIGRKPKAVSISSQYGNIVCINLTSKNHFSYVIYNIAGDIIEKRQQIVEKQHSYIDNFNILTENIKLALEKINTVTIGIGLSVPSAYYEEEDIVNNDLIKEFKGVHFRRILADTFGISNTLVSHDVFTAAQAEFENCFPAVESLFFFYIGEGIGGAYINNGKPLMGKNLVAGEIGQFLVNIDNQKMTLEEAAAIPQILKRLSKLGYDISFYEALELIDSNDDIRSVFNEATDIVCQCLYNIVWVLNPEKIIIDSEYKKYSSFIINYCDKYIKKIEDNIIPTKMTVDCSKINSHSAMYGLFNLVRDEWINEVSKLE